MIASIKRWMLSFIAGPYPAAALFIFAFAESSFFPIPPDVLLIPMVLKMPERYLFFATIATLASVLGGMAGYVIGVYGGRPLMSRWFSARRIATVHDYYERYNAWATGIAGLTPLPYKLFTIGAGAFGVNFRIFVLASALSRGLRFYIVAALTASFGPAVQPFVKRYFNLITILFVLVLLGGFLAVGRLGRRKKRRSR